MIIQFISKRATRFCSVVLIYAIFLNYMIPFSLAMSMDMNRLKSNNTNLHLLEYLNGESNDSNNEIERLPQPDLLSSATMSSANDLGGQAESSGFSIGSTDGMVNKFTGDFAYSIPLMDVDGYPLVLSYSSADVSMLSEPSWVGLGWNFNVGSISRDMRGLPDDFNGSDEVIRETKQKVEELEGKKNGGYLELGFNQVGVSLNFLLGDYTNSYLGTGRTVDLSLGSSYSVGLEGLFFAQSLNIGFNYDSKNGIGTTKALGLNGLIPGVDATFAKSGNTRYGLQSKSMSLGLSKSLMSTNAVSASGSYSTTTTIPYGSQTFIPKLSSSNYGSSENFEQNYYASIKLSSMAITVGYINQQYESYSTIEGADANGFATIYQPCYGYYHLGKRTNANNDSKYPLMDFNRGVDNEFSEEMKTLPFSIQTYDIFYANAAGLHETFRPHRSDKGTFYDPDAARLFNQESEKFTDHDDQSNLSVGAIVNTVQLAFGIALGYSSGTMKNNINTGAWNQAISFLSFANQSASNDFDNSLYFRSVGENTPSDLSDLALTGGMTPSSLVISNSNDQVALSSTLSSGGVLNSSSINNNSSTLRNAVDFQPKTASQLPNTKIKYKNSNGINITKDRVSDYRKGNHLSSIQVKSESGTIYKYGIPAYTIKNVDVSFASEGLATTSSPESGLIAFSGNENSETNSLGRSNLYEETTTPAFAHSFLLTEMYGSDYIDRTNDGPTIDDIGNFYHFNYEMKYGTGSTTGQNFTSRFPVRPLSQSSGKSAFNSRNALGSELDDVASYSYAEKEIWYAQSIETKNVIVEFELEARQDVYSVDGNTGVPDSNKPAYCLKKIKLYSRADKMANGASSVPLQTIEFIYGYSLCQNYPTHTGGGENGKLTLLEIRYYAGNSDEMALNSYKFYYSELNPIFDPNDVDGWNQYKPNADPMPNVRYPYPEQDEITANEYAGAWKLIRITNPNGGELIVDYESDTYANVQNHRAMRHFNIHRMTDMFDFLGIQSEPEWDGVHRFNGAQMNSEFHHSYSSVNSIVSEFGLSPVAEALLAGMIETNNVPYLKKFGKLDVKLVPNNVIIFELDTPISGNKSDAEQQVKRDYFYKGNSASNPFMNELYVKIHATVKQGVEDFVPAMLTISEDWNSIFKGKFLGSALEDFKSIGVMPKDPVTGMYEYGYVVVDPVNTGNRENKSGSDEAENGSLMMHPAQLAVLEFSRKYLVDKVYGSSPDAESDLSLDWRVLFGQDIYKQMVKNAGYAPSFYSNSSTLRMFEPDNIKMGGGSRVKSITYKDNWDVLTDDDQDLQTTSNVSEQSASYKWNYNYHSLIDGKEISNGVAAYETGNMLDENPMYSWITYVNIKKKFPDEKVFVPGPIGHQLMPNPVVGYSHVEVTFEGLEDYGKSIAEFYTAKDFPTIVKSTGLGKIDLPKKNVVTGEQRNYYGLSQGHYVETNDFHGKQKQDVLIDNEGNIISKSVYHYYNLGSPILYCDRTESLSNQITGVTYDFHGDSRYMVDKNTYNHVGLTVTLMYSPPLTFSISIKPDYSQNSRELAFYANTLIKHTNYSAILNEVTTEYLGSVNTARTEVYDLESGNAIVTSLKDEFNDRLYSVNYPAHWKYKEFRPSYNIEERSATVSLDANGYFSASPGDLGYLFTPGDLVKVTGYSGEFHIARNWPWPSSDMLFLIDENGSKFIPSVAGNFELSIITTNRANTLGIAMQSLVSKVNPVNLGTMKLNCDLDQIISSSAMTYRDRLTTKCGRECPDGDKGELYNNNMLSSTGPYNPYLFGMRGDLVVDNSMIWQGDRSSHSEHNVRFGGVYDQYSNYYSLNSTSGIWEADQNVFSKWRKTSRVMYFNQFGVPIESVDQISVNSSVLFGYSPTFELLPIAQAVNAKKSQIAFDGFEDYYFTVEDDVCAVIASEHHFDFAESLLGSGVDISSNEKHSGLSSLRIQSGHSATVSKPLSFDPDCNPLNVIESTTSERIVMDECNCTPSFNPSPGTYIISGWVKVDSGNYSDAKVLINFTSSSVLPIYASGVILDGWKRFEAEIEVPSEDDFTLILENVGEGNVYFDDIRIHPFLAGMQTTVYDPVTMLPLATHDGYNFTTFYNYDENLQLVRIRVETEEGIKTISESEFGSQKSFIGE